jgi:4-hydroxybenzoate polyprenyltransferase
VALFFIAGSVGMVAVLLMATGGLAGLPFAIVTWSLATLAGYRIWRMDHPDDSAWKALRQRLGWYTGVALGAAVSIDDNGPNTDGGESDGGTGDGGAS